jgi:hypothetical protein
MRKLSLRWGKRLFSIFWVRLLAKLVAIALTGGILYGMMLFERALLAMLGPTFASWYQEHDVIVGLTWCSVVISLIAGLFWSTDRIVARIRRRSAGRPAPR